MTREGRGVAVVMRSEVCGSGDANCWTVVVVRLGVTRKEEE